MLVNVAALERAGKAFKGQAPFDHTVVDDFFLPDVAAALEAEFPVFDSPVWHKYDNPIEIKKSCNNWNAFPPLTYQMFTYLNSEGFTEILRKALGLELLEPDPGLNGGGWHIHKRGGKLNTHLDYNIHPKLHLQRKVNIIIYMNSTWQPEWGGQLGFWEQNPERRKPGNLIQSIDPAFNRAVIFDTTQNSWHGLPTPLDCPEGQTRRSLAVYYLAPAPQKAEERGKALYAPTPDQENDQAVLDLIVARAQIGTAASVYTVPKPD